MNLEERGKSERTIILRIKYGILKVIIDSESFCFILEVDPHLAQEQEQSKLTPKGDY